MWNEGVEKTKTKNKKRDHCMLPCMASGRSGTDHAQTPPKAESLRVPVFRHHLPQTWVSSLFLFSFFHYLWLHARSLFSTCANLRVWNPLRHSSQFKLFTGKLRAALWPHASTEFRRCIFVRFFLRREVCSHIRSERLRSGNALCVKKKRKKKKGADRVSCQQGNTIDSYSLSEGY